MSEYWQWDRCPSCGNKAWVQHGNVEDITSPDILPARECWKCSHRWIPHEADWDEDELKFACDIDVNDERPWSEIRQEILEKYYEKTQESP